jgi:hypothetical protein
MSAFPQWRRTACVCAFAVSTTATAAAQTFKVANWNIRSGSIAAMTGPRQFNSNTNNCTDPTQPLNAWGVGVPQAELRKLNSDPNIVALALEEAWFCGAPARVRDALGWTASLPDRNGTSIVARYGFAGPAVATQLDTSLNANPGDTAWMIDVAVCLDPRCTRRGAYVRRALGRRRTGEGCAGTADHRRDGPARDPHLLIGDLNAYDAEGSNCPPPVPSTQLPMPAPLAISTRGER